MGKAEDARIGLRLASCTLAVLALVAASTLVLVAPEFFGAHAGATRPALLTVPAFGHA